MAEKSKQILKDLRDSEIEATGDYSKGIKALHKEGDEEGASLLKHIQSEEKHHKEELEDKMADNRARVHLGGMKKSAAKKGGKKRTVHKMHIRRTANGGYIAEHEFKGEPGEPPIENEEHHIPDLDTLQAHVGEHMAFPREEEAPPVTPTEKPPALPAEAPSRPIGV
jgi:hypothetical protein